MGTVCTLQTTVSDTVLTLVPVTRSQTPKEDEDEDESMFNVDGRGVVQWWEV